MSNREMTKIVARWLGDDVVYAVLPIIVLAVITLCLGQSFEHFSLLKEWSFATIVLFGVSLRRFVRLKVTVQREPLSHKVDTGIQFLMLCLVMSVVVLSLVVLWEHAALTLKRPAVLGAVQLSLFGVGLSSVLFVVWAEERR